MTFEHAVNRTSMELPNESTSWIKIMWFDTLLMLEHSSDEQNAEKAMPNVIHHTHTVYLPIFYIFIQIRIAGKPNITIKPAEWQKCKPVRRFYVNGISYDWWREYYMTGIPSYAQTYVKIITKNCFCILCKTSVILLFILIVIIWWRHV